MLHRLKLALLVLVCLFGLGIFLRTAYLDLTVDLEEDLAGSILVWHGWGEENGLILEDIVERFVLLHPQVKVYLVPVETEELLLRFEEAAETGFGPNLLIGPNEWIAPLADANAIVPITEKVDETILARYLPGALTALQHEGELYGLPQSLHTLSLYYNRDLVETPATTLDELMVQAEAGIEVGLNTSFELAFWGIRAFGGRVFGEDGRVVLDQGGFANWLNWLKTAQDIPTVILSSDQTALRTLFIENDLGYLVDNSRAWPELAEAMGEGNVGVLPLPNGPTGAPGPLLRVEALLLSAASSPHQTNIALALATFLTNAEQQTMLMRQAEQIPANMRVRINPRLNPVIAAFATQARSAVPYTPGDAMETVLQMGNGTYAEVLEGLVTPAEAAATLTASANRALGFAVTENSSYQCESVGDFTLWHTWRDTSAAALERLIDDFTQDCPNIYVRTQHYPPNELLTRLANVPPSGGPELLLIDHTLLDRLITDTRIRAIGPLIDDELLQRYRPLALNAFRHQERLYGLPLALRTQALIYNENLIDTPASTLDDLLDQATQGTQLALTLDFADAFWGIPAFGGRLRDETGRVLLDEAAFAEWLRWVQEANQSGALVIDDPTALDQRFVAGEIAYRIATSDRLPFYLEALGEQSVGVALLPSGPEEEAAPLTTVSGFVIATSEERTIPSILEFIRYATRAEAQQQLLQEAFLLPANANANVDAESLLSTYAEQLSTALLHPIGAAMESLTEFGGDAYVWIESGVLSAQEAAAEAADLFERTNAPSANVSVMVCEGSGSLEFWHAWQDNDADVLAQIAEQFSATCPQIEVTVRAVGEEALRDRFTSTDEDGPALLLAPSEWTDDLVAADAIEPLGSLLDAAIFRQLLPNAERTVQIEAQTYALPLVVETTVLYINQQRVDAPAVTLDELLREAQIGRRVVLLGDRSETIWGLGAFAETNAAPDATFTPPTEENGVATPGTMPSRTTLLNWFDWLQRAQRTPGVTIGSEDELSLATFAAGRIAYHTGGPDLIADLRQALGADVLGATPLPAGPGGPASPLLLSQALYLPSQPAAAPTDPAQQALRTLARYLISVDAQTILMSEAHKVPANRLVNTATDPVIAAFAAQTETALPAPSPWGVGFVQALEATVAAVLDGELSPEEAANQLMAE